MIAILCIDDYNGMMFNHRRQSKDCVLLENVLELCKGYKLYVNEYSNKMFTEYGIMEQIEDSNFPQTAKEGEYCFIENFCIGQYIDKIEKIVLYKWNRHYPADLFFDATIIDEWKLVDTVDFIGNSHEKITREIYKR